ncbi:MAG: hypothetical protein JWQ30_2081 [Sediminibacterium sp.]|nr:hypothetical protein [Sediminibacterium sp.]
MFTGRSYGALIFQNVYNLQTGYPAGAEKINLRIIETRLLKSTKPFLCSFVYSVAKKSSPKKQAAELSNQFSIKHLYHDTL